MKTIGLLPMVLSTDAAASMWRSMSLTVLFGTITGTMLTLLVIPTAYYMMENPKKSFHGMLNNLKFLKHFTKYWPKKFKTPAKIDTKIPRIVIPNGDSFPAKAPSAPKIKI
jgi:hypothetical protein